MTEDARDPGRQSDAAVRERRRTRRPRRYRVLLHNDDFTTMDFVVDILVRFFHKTRTEATQIMLEVHKKGMGVAGAYTYDAAQTKVVQVTDYARAEGMPLKCTMEPEA